MTCHAILALHTDSSCHIKPHTIIRLALSCAKDSSAAACCLQYSSYDKFVVVGDSHAWNAVFIRALLLDICETFSS